MNQAEAADPFLTVCVGDVLLILGIVVTCDLEQGTVTITQNSYTKYLLEWYDVACCKPRYTPRVGKELYLDQPERT